jgi:hypothetical protein
MPNQRAELAKETPTKTSRKRNMCILLQPSYA